MRTVLVLVGNEFRRFAADKAAISLTFIVPLVLIYIFGNVFGVNSEERGPKGIALAVVNETDAPASAAIVSALQKEPAFKVITSHKDANGVERVLTEAEVREMMRADDIRFALIFPADATSDSEMALKMKFLRNARNEIETETVDGLVQKTIFIGPAGVARIVAAAGRESGCQRDHGAFQPLVSRRDRPRVRRRSGEDSALHRNRRVQHPRKHTNQHERELVS